MDGRQLCFFIPSEIKKPKLRLFENLGKTVGFVIEGNIDALANLPSEIIPIVGCTIKLRALIQSWQVRGRDFIYWDRGYVRRDGKTWLPRGRNGGYYRWHRNSFQMQQMQVAPADRWLKLSTSAVPWRKDKFARHIVVATPSDAYCAFHGIDGWEERTITELKKHTDRKIVVRRKDYPGALRNQLDRAHALVTHGSIVAVESVILGCPVFVDPSSAAALVGLTDLTSIEHPICPDRNPWLYSLAYCQFSEDEMLNGTLWRMIR